MSSEAKTEEDLREEIGTFLQKNFPQIEMHMGSAAIQNLDRESGEVSIQLGGACSGCGISPMTVQAIKKRMVNEIAEIEAVHANTGGGGGGGHGDKSPSFPGETTDSGESGGEDDGTPTAPPRNSFQNINTNLQSEGRINRVVGEPRSLRTIYSARRPDKHR